MSNIILNLEPKTVHHKYKAYKFDGTKKSYEFIISQIKDIDSYQHDFDNIDKIMRLVQHDTFYNDVISIHKNSYIITEDDFLILSEYTINEIKKYYNIIK